MSVILAIKSLTLPKLNLGSKVSLSKVEGLQSAKVVDWISSPTGIASAINVLALVVSAYLALLVGEELLKIELFKPPVTEISGGNVEIENKKNKNQESYQVILSRNLFGSTAPPPKETPPPSPVAKPKLRLVGTNPQKSHGGFAIIEDQNKNEQDVFNVSEQVFTFGKLIEVNSDYVKLEYPDRVDTLEIEDGKGAVPSGSPLEDTPPANDQTDFTVSEAELNDALGNLPLLLSQARAVPYFRNGQSIGMRLFAIRSGSMYEKLGLQNGDIITSVNESSLSDPTQALRLFEQLKSERNIGVKMERNGAARESRYSIR
jgi:general secretion pathway protein C